MLIWYPIDEHGVIMQHTNGGQNSKRQLFYPCVAGLASGESGNDRSISLEISAMIIDNDKFVKLGPETQLSQRDCCKWTESNSVACLLLIL